VTVFEPSAGNGLLTIAADPKNVVVNEVDSLRRGNLKLQGYKQVLKQDATGFKTRCHKTIYRI